MRLPRLRTVLLTPVVLFAIFYIGIAILVALDDREVAVLEAVPAEYGTIAIFGASGTAGDGILKAALADPDIDRIHVITRRATPRIEEGIAAGKVLMTLHTDYQDYTANHEQIANVDAVFWAIGLSSLGVDEETYTLIHVDFPMAFVREWLDVRVKPGISFHYISSSDISEDSSAMWAREKYRAEQELFGLAAGTPLRVIAYRPDYIGPTEEEAHLGQDMLYWFFSPVRAAVRAEQIGQAMIEVTARGDQFDNGAKLTTSRIIRHAESYTKRLSASQP